MSYTKRIPSALRGQFAKCAHTFRHLARGATDTNRGYVISTGSLRFVMWCYSMSAFAHFPSGGVRKEPEYTDDDDDEFEHPFDLYIAAYYGNKKVFWYLHDLFIVSPRKEIDTIVYYALTTMIVYDHLDLLREYFLKYPCFVRQLTDGPSRCVRPALFSCNANIIKYLVQMGAKINGYDTDSLEEMLRSQMLEYGTYTDETYKIEFKQLCGRLFPIVTELRAKYPKRINEYAIKHLIPDEELIDDDEELVSSDVDP